MSKRGGVRACSCRPPGSGKYGEPTRPVRVPVSLAPTLENWLTLATVRLSSEVAGVEAPALAPLPLFDPEPSSLSRANNRRQAAWNDDFRAQVMFG